MKPVDKPVRGWEWVALVLIVLGAALLRMGAPGITEFKRDEANLSRLALDMAQGRSMPWLGISSSVGIPNPPLNVYLFALPYVLDSSPLTATLFVGALNILAVMLASGLSRRYYGPVAGVVTGILYAVSPWAVIYSRKIWAQDLLPPFVIMTVFTGLLGYGENKRWARLVHWPLLIVTVQLHYGAFTLIPVSVLMLVVWHTSIRWRELIIGWALAAATLMPFAIGLVQHDLLTPDTLDGLNQADHDRVVSTTALDYARFTIAGTDIHSLAGPEQFENYLASVPDVYWLFDLIPLAVLGAMVWLGWRLLRQKTVRTTPDAVLLAWLVIPVLAFVWEWTEVVPHYMIPMMPAAFILCGAATNALGTIQLPAVRRLSLGITGGLVLIIAGLQITLFVRLLDFLDTHETPDGFGTPLHYLLDARAAIYAQNPSDVIVISNQELAPYDEIPAVWDVLLNDIYDVRFVDGTRTYVIPANPRAESTLELVVGMSERLVSDIQVCPCLTFGRRPGVEPLIVRPVMVPSIQFDSIEPIRFANGAYLTGYATNHPAGIVLRWELSGPVADDYQTFLHILDANGNRLAHVDRVVWPGRYWRASDTLLLWYDVELPSNATEFYAGMYLVDGEIYHNAEVLDENGAYIAQGATISLGN